MKLLEILLFQEWKKSYNNIYIYKNKKNMIKVKFDKKIYNIKSKLEDIMIGDFEKIANIMSSSTNYIDMWNDIFLILGLPQEVIDNMDSSDFINIINEIDINISTSIDIDYKLHKQIKINGINYKIKHDVVKISVKEMRIIENVIKKSDNKYIADIMAILYKDDLSEDNYDLTYIEEKSNLFRENVTIDKALPFLKYLSNKVVKDFNLIRDEFNNI